MKKDYKNKSIESESIKTKQKFFFPKANPPQTVEAESFEEALEIINSNK